MNQNATQVFYFVNNFHDWLRRAPIGFTAAAGNFEGGRSGRSANTARRGRTPPAAFPTATTSTTRTCRRPPDGMPPTMQMYLFHCPARCTDDDPFLPSNGGDDADVIYHEYTHGLSNRLVVDSLGNSTLNSQQAGSMGEAWSDWYAMDYLADTTRAPRWRASTDSDGRRAAGRQVRVGGATP